MKLVPIPAFSDNYIWVLHDDQQAIVVDPGESAGVQGFLQQHGLKLHTILVTHHHADHIGGVAELKQRHHCQVIAPADARIPMSDHTVNDNDRLAVASGLFQGRVMHVPGHTLTHVAYAGEGVLFCGDTLFSIGCGRLFEGTPEQMLASLKRLSALPDTTLVCCAHEYTLNNIDFALHVLPGHPGLLAYQQVVKQRLAAGEPSLPSTIGTEKALNPFLNCHRPEIRAAAEKYCGKPLASEAAVFACLRQWKDHF